MGSTREGTVEHNIPSRLKCAEHCLFRLGKEPIFVQATHTDWSRLVGTPENSQEGRGGTVRPYVPIAKSATVFAVCVYRFGRVCVCFMMLSLIALLIEA